MFNLKSFTSKRRSVTILDEVISGSPVIVFRAHYVATWPIIEISKNIEELGYDAKLLKKKKIAFKELMHPDDWAELHRTLPTKPTETFRLSMDLRITDSSEAYHSISANLQIVAKPDNYGYYIQGTLQKKESKKAAPLLMAVRFGQMSQLIDYMPVPAMVVQGPEFHSNSRVEELTGYDSSEVLTVNNWFYLLYPDEGQDMEEKYFRDRGNGYPVNWTVKITRKDGEKRWVTISIHKISKLELWFFQDVTDLRISNEALRRQQDLFKRIVDALPVMVLMYDNSGRFTFINKAVEENTGYDREYILNHSVLKELFPDPDYRREVWRHMQSEIPDWQEIKFQTRNGGHFRSSWTNFEFDRETRVGIGLDVSLIHQLQKTLKLTQNQFRTIADQMADFVFILDKEKRYSSVYGTWKARKDFPEEKFIGKTAAEFFGIKGTNIHDTNHEKALRGIPSTYEFSMELGNEKRWMKSTVSPLRNQKGAIIGAIGVSHDVTSLKKTYEQLSMYERALQASAIAIVIVDDEGIINWANEAMTILTGYKLSEIKDKPISIFQSEKQDENVYASLWETVKNGDIWTGTLTNKKKDGSSYLERQTITPFVGLEGKQFFICVKVDITETTEKIG